MITFTITFHGPFHVGSGTPTEGLDSTVDLDNLLPGSSLKGVMRAAAAEVLGVPEAVVGAVFGTPGRGFAPWAWSDAEFIGATHVTPVARIRMDDETGTTRRGFLMLGQHVWANAATFTVSQTSNDLPRPAVERHRLLLRAAARAVTSVGATRRRGEGWVSITDDQDVTDGFRRDLLGVLR